MHLTTTMLSDHGLKYTFKKIQPYACKGYYYYYFLSLGKCWMSMSANDMLAHLFLFVLGAKVVKTCMPHLRYSI